MHGRGDGASGLTVMTQNLYVGADVDAVITALATPDPNDDIPALLDAVATIERTDFPARADAIADEIGRTRPVVVGLQEVSTIGVDIPPLGVSLHVDFLPILLDALAAEGLNYVVAIEYENFTASPAPGISLTDAEAILVDASRVQVLSAAGHTFAANLGVVAPGVDLQRGWVTMEAVVDGTPYTFVSLHTEGTGPDELLLQLHALQVGEMAASLGTASPAVVIGDFNAQPGSPAYQVMVDAGFTDVWGALRPGVRGYTCCQAGRPVQPTAHSSHERIDYVWTRGLGDARGPQFAAGPGGPVRQRAVGPDPELRRRVDLALRPRGGHRQHPLPAGSGDLTSLTVPWRTRESRRDPMDPGGSLRVPAARGPSGVQRLRGRGPYTGLTPCAAAAQRARMVVMPAMARFSCSAWMTSP